MRIRLILAMALKELRHIFRDGQTLFIILSLPVVMMFLFGYALKSEVEDASVVVLDAQQSMDSRLLIQALDASRQFKVAGVVTQGEPRQLLNRFRARAVLSIPVDFDQTLQNFPIPFSIWLDGSDPAIATTLRSTLPGFLQKHLQFVSGLGIPELVMIKVRFLFNPSQESALFFVPGLMATILAMISALLTSVTVTREKENGTLSNLRISRLRSGEIVLGKLIPYFVIAALMGVLILLMGRVFFGVVVQGDRLFLVLATSVYLVTNLSIGVFISTLVSKQQHAMLLALGITMMPTIMLSGFIFPVTSMPSWLQAFSSVIPATWYLQIVRSVILKAASFQDLPHPLLVLTGMTMVLLIFSSIRFAKEK